MPSQKILASQTAWAAQQLAICGATNLTVSIRIQCPQCGRELKVPDRSLLGRKGKCPKCRHSFVLVEPSATPDSDLATEGIPPSMRPFTGPLGVSHESDVPSIEAATPPAAMTNFEIPPPPAAPSPFAVLDSISETQGAAARLKELQRARQRRTRLAVAIGGLILILGGGIVMLLTRTTDPNWRGRQDAAQTANVVGCGPDRDDVDSSDPSQTEYARRGSPTHGPPIELKYIPFGAQVVVHLKPAELWKEQSRGEELRRCVPPLAQLIEHTLFKLFQLKPDDIEELLLCLIPGQRGDPPDVAAVARTREVLDRDQRIAQFGLRLLEFEQPVYATGATAYFIADPKTLVTCPLAQAEEMVKAIGGGHPAELLDPLLPMTDRDRHLTVVFDPLTLKLHDAWFAENLRPLLKNSIDWLPESIDAASWSMHFTDELFYSELLLHSKDKPPKSVEREIQQRLEQLAGDLLPWFEKMNPTEQGKRMIIGRVPAMIEVCSMATIVRHGPHHVQLVTPLPDRAAPNLFLGTLLAWDESTRTDFSAARRTSTETPTRSIPISDRLAMRIDVDFRAAPMNEAFSFIAGEIKTPIEIDGDALKAGGFTKNIKQAFQMDGVPAQDVIARIFSESKSIEGNPEKCLVLVVDDVNQRILITTLAAADRKKLKRFTLP